MPNLFQHPMKMKPSYVYIMTNTIEQHFILVLLEI